MASLVGYAVNKAERAHLSKVADLGCILCYGLAEIHHIKDGHGSTRANHYETIPLCYHHHRGEEGFHHLGKRRWEAKYGKQRDHLARVNEEVGYGS